MKSSLVVISVMVVLLGIATWLFTENKALRTQLASQVAPMAATKTTDADASAATAANVHLPSASEKASGAQTVFNRDSWSNREKSVERYNQAYLQVEVKNARFFQHLKGWSAERIEALKSLLANQSMRLMDQAIANSSSGKTESFGDEQNVLRIQNETELQSALSDEEYATYEETERMEMSRETVSDIVKAMRSRGKSLDPAAEDAVLQAYAKALHETASRSPAISVSQLSPEQIATYEQMQMQKFNETMMHHMFPVLSDDQLKVFMEAYLEHQGGA